MLIVVFAAFVGSPLAHAQSTEFTLDPEGEWIQERAPEPGTDEAVMADVAALIASNQPQLAFSTVNNWIHKNEGTDNQWLARAFLLRGDARVAMGHEFKAMFDYERHVIQRYPQSEEFVRAIERELEIAIRYAHGLRRKILGMRLVAAGGVAEETFIRVQERLPGSELAERAAIELADYYYRNDRLELAAIAYDLYVVNFPGGPNVHMAMERRIRANVARFKGPKYDGSSLLDAREQIQIFDRMYPADAERTGLDQRLVDRIDEALADQILESAKYYLKRRDVVSARYTLRRLLQKYPNSHAAGEALGIMERRGWIEAEAPAAERLEEGVEEIIEIDAPESDAEQGAPTPEEQP